MDGDLRGLSKSFNSKFNSAPRSPYLMVAQRSKLFIGLSPVIGGQLSMTNGPLFLAWGGTDC